MFKFSIFSIILTTFQSFYLIFFFVFLLTFKRNYLYRAVSLCSIWTINENPLQLSMPSQSACLYGLFINCYPQAVLGLQPLTKQIRI